MKSKTNRLLTLLALVTLSTAAWSQESQPVAPLPRKQNRSAIKNPTQPAITAADVQALKDGLAAQQHQIQQLAQQLQQAQQNWQQAQAAATEAAGKAAAAQAQLSRQQETVGELKDDLASLKDVSDSAQNNAVLKNAVLSSSLQEPGQIPGGEPLQVFNKQMESPITIRFRGINITPGGYAAAEFVRRSHALGADRQSKVTVFVDGRLKNVGLSSYVSGDFLSAGVTSTSTSTNSYTLRIRQAWAQAKFDSGWSFLGGQSWSLVTEDGKGIAPDDDMGKTNDARPKTIDSSYNVGFDYARQYGIRLTKSYDKVAFAVSLENPQATLTTHGNASNFLLGETGASNSYNTATNYSFNPAPDIIAKVAFDPGFGHYEIYGLYDRFRDRVFPCVEFANNPALCGAGASALGAHNASRNGGGLGASARWALFSRHIVFGLKGFGGSGVGRYAPGGLSDASVNPDGTLHLIKNLHGLGTLEWKSKKLDVYSYGGVEYAGRSWGIDDTNPAHPVPVGYGAPAFSNAGCYAETAPGSGGFSPGSLSACTADTRALIEGTLGFWYRFYSGPRGRFQYGTQLSYVTRNTWSGNGREPNGIDTMVFTSFRYYLP